MDNLFDDYEMDAFDRAQLKKDKRNHPRTSYESLGDYAKALRATGNTVTRAELDAAKAWLDEFQSELPAELENAAGQTGGKGMVISVELGDYQLDDNASKYEEHGMYYVAEHTCNESLESLWNNDSREFKRQPDGPYSAANRKRLMAKRAAKYAEYADEQRKRLRWRGMEEWDAVAKADDKLREGAGLSAGASTAVPLPSVERLRELFTVEDGELVWAVSRGTVAKGSQVRTKQVQVDGSKFTVKRIVYKLVTGDDPQSAAVSADLSLNKYRVRGGCTAERPRVNFENAFDALVRIGSEVITVGTYKTVEQAEEAAAIYIRAMEMGLRE